ncbi:serine hydrolase domain-containing protein [Halalkalibacter urbisdiaboli]|uniref:serine hydrolase domain-containing protein n=1 Tax=Halalkalibacter urbisdiaboli TaxID=1960589 RepID=UPI000B43457C|nr:serine hydrolase domain-containing protein [Halalkalibacter urbisdiaboli]
MESSKKLQPLLRSFVEKGPAGNSLAVMHQGKTVFEDYVGYADKESQLPIGKDTIFRIYSMTKVVTCTAALMLYERGLFLLNDPLEAYLPEFKDPHVYRSEADASPASRSITVRDLFTMTSGLTYPGDGNPTERQIAKALGELNETQRKNSTSRDLSKLLASIPLAFDPGTQWRYGFSHDVLGALIEVVSGKTLGEFLDEEILKPLGMRDTFFTLPENKKHRLASIYNREEDGSLIKNETLDEEFQPNATFESGGAGLLSTLGDYGRFAHMLANGGEFNGTRIIGSKTIQLMATNHLTAEQKQYYNWDYLKGYGYGLGVRTMIDPAEAGINSSIGEFGWSGLAGTWVLIDPKEKLSAVYMQQMLPNFEAFQQPRLRNVIYGAL